MVCLIVEFNAKQKLGKRDFYKEAWYCKQLQAVVIFLSFVENIFKVFSSSFHGEKVNDLTQTI